MATTSHDRVYQELLEWTRVGETPEGSGWAVEVAEIGGAGRGLVALEDIAAGEVLIQVPFDKVFRSVPSSNMHWAAGMAAQLLRELRRCNSSSDDGGSGWCPWVRALPRDVLTPLGWSNEVVEALGDPGAVDEVLGMRATMAECYGEVKPDLDALGYGEAEFLWAVQVFTSRCFFEPAAGCHMAVPGVDMANHSFAPNAEVRIRHSVDYVQGRSALEEVCELPPPSPSLFQLVAGPDGVRKGDEVTICYGSAWPSEPFLLLFGFVPEGNKADAVVLFPSLLDLAAAYVTRCLAAGSDDDSSDELQSAFDALAATQQVQEACASGRFERLVVTAEGMDARMLDALAFVEGAAQQASCLPAQAAIIEGVAFVLESCRERLECLQLASSAAQPSVPGAAVAAAFREPKQQILEALLQPDG